MNPLIEDANRRAALAAGETEEHAVTSAYVAALMCSRCALTPTPEIVQDSIRRAAIARGANPAVVNGMGFLEPRDGPTFAAELALSRSYGGAIFASHTVESHVRNAQRAEKIVAGLLAHFERSDARYVLDKYERKLAAGELQSIVDQAHFLFGAAVDGSAASAGELFDMKRRIAGVRHKLPDAVAKLIDELESDDDGGGIQAMSLSRSTGSSPARGSNALVADAAARAGQAGQTVAPSRRAALAASFGFSEEVVSLVADLDNG